MPIRLGPPPTKRRNRPATDDHRRAYPSHTKETTDTDRHASTDRRAAADACHRDRTDHRERTSYCRTDHQHASLRHTNLHTLALSRRAFVVALADTVNELNRETPTCTLCRRWVIPTDDDQATETDRLCTRCEKLKTFLGDDKDPRLYTSDLAHLIACGHCGHRHNARLIYDEVIDDWRYMLTDECRERKELRGALSIVDQVHEAGNLSHTTNDGDLSLIDSEETHKDDQT